MPDVTAGYKSIAINIFAGRQLTLERDGRDFKWQWKSSTIDLGKLKEHQEGIAAGTVEFSEVEVHEYTDITADEIAAFEDAIQNPPKYCKVEDGNT